jgi:hypothetical protein
MFDPAVLGTLLIGLNAERASTQVDRRRRGVSAANQDGFRIRTTIARGLRRAAALLDQPAVGSAAN